MTARRLIPLILVGALWAVPAGAADTPPPPGAAPPPAQPGEQARQGLDLLMKALEGWVRQMPMFAAPEVTPEGDIVIRRLDRNRPAPSEPAPQKPETKPGAAAPDAPTDL
ncbi:hypothetical protein [Azospirillum isscasi]|uniref:Uncharacterized protein n=1 Tax=Azospirillum isscasi TaxID=3053926 RepID=A0ABU0WBL9_9PROT|nr:hypothetical protein [Azospirillum isscasi]MDQ2101581.1 hypothetical protein [Azospirillum isscasi]